MDKAVVAAAIAGTSE
ncbi:hypothetical protein Tco_0602908, partial [Tanacetum coccineum]